MRMSPSSIHHGVDTGTEGGSTLVDGVGVLASWAWRPRQLRGLRVFQVGSVVRVDGVLVLSSKMVPTFGDIGRLIASDSVRITGRTSWPIGQEKSILDMSKGVSTALRCGWIAGATCGPLERYAEGRVILGATATVWRHVVLGMSPRTKREQAKKASLTYMPALVPGLTEAIRLISAEIGRAPEQLDHVADSAGVAKWLEKQEGK